MGDPGRRVAVPLLTTDITGSQKAGPVATRWWPSRTSPQSISNVGTRAMAQEDFREEENFISGAASRSLGPIQA